MRHTQCYMLTKARARWSLRAPVRCVSLLDSAGMAEAKVVSIVKRKWGSNPSPCSQFVHSHLQQRDSKTGRKEKKKKKKQQLNHKEEAEETEEAELGSDAEQNDSGKWPESNAEEDIGSAPEPTSVSVSKPEPTYVCLTISSTGITKDKVRTRGTEAQLHVPMKLWLDDHLSVLRHVVGQSHFNRRLIFWECPLHTSYLGASNINFALRFLFDTVRNRKTLLTGLKVCEELKMSMDTKAKEETWTVELLHDLSGVPVDDTYPKEQYKIHMLDDQNDLLRDFLGVSSDLTKHPKPTDRGLAINCQRCARTCTS